MLAVFCFPLKTAQAITFLSSLSAAGSSLSGAGLTENNVTGAGNYYSAETARSEKSTGGPSVDVSFLSSGNFKDGANVQAKAVTSGFKNDAADLYFTWFLKQEDCTASSCDYDDDNDYDENDWKIAAARIIVQGDFNNSEASYSSVAADDEGGVRAIPSNSDWNGDNNDNSGDIDNCYIKEENGYIYELSETKDPSYSCLSGSAACLSDTTTTCEIDNPAYVDPITTPTEPEHINQDCGYCYSTTASTDMLCENIDEDRMKGSATCSSTGATPICLASSSSSNLFCTNSADVSRGLCLLSSNVCSSLCSGGTCTNGMTCGVVRSTYYTTPETPKCSFKKGDNLCKHLFPEYENALSGEDVGDKSFGAREKEFWGANPENSSTNGNQLDEAAVMGLGVDEFSWTYAEGDQVGVIVEGETSIPTKHSDGSSMIMWAFPNGCEDAIGESGVEKAFYVENDEIEIRTIKNIDLNDCIEENLLDPEGDGLGEASVSLSVLPENLVNDENGDGGSLATVSASVQTFGNDAASLYYDWSIQESGDNDSLPSNATSWRDVTDELTKHSDLTGFGKDKFQFVLNLPGHENDKVFYLRVKVDIKDATDCDGDNCESVSGYTVIKVSQQEESLIVYSSIAENDGKLRLGDPGCSAETCYLAKDTVVGIKTKGDAAVYGWKVNGVAASCSGEMSSDCTGSKNNVLFFPITGENGEKIDVVATIQLDSGQTSELVKRFIVKEGSTMIESSDVEYDANGECVASSKICPKLLGYYMETAESPRKPDYSTEVFEAKEGSEINFTTALSLAAVNINWIVDGVIQDEYNNSSAILLPISKKAGESYAVTVSPSPKNTGDAGAAGLNNMRKALWNNWGIKMGQYEQEGKNGASIQVDVVSDLIGMKDKKGVMASLASNLPKNTLFALEVVLAGFLIIISTSLLFAFIPEAAFKEEERDGRVF